MKFAFGRFEMNNVNQQQWKKSGEHLALTANDIDRAVNDLCEKALDDAKAQLHPLLRTVQVERLGQRREFLKAFKVALEQRIARTLAAWQPTVLAVFKFDEIRIENVEGWDASIHLLVKVPRLSNAMKVLGKTLDKSLVQCLKQLGWTRFQMCQSILDVQQVTPNELRHGVSYGAMFCAVYNTPVKIWPQDGVAP